MSFKPCSGEDVQPQTMLSSGLLDAKHPQRSGVWMFKIWELPQTRGSFASSESSILEDSHMSSRRIAGRESNTLILLSLAHAEFGPHQYQGLSRLWSEAELANLSGRNAKTAFGQDGA